jgi:hypothetical protein
MYINLINNLKKLLPRYLPLVVLVDNLLENPFVGQTAHLHMVYLPAM